LSASNAQMSQLQQALPADPAVKLITLTTDPEYDRPPCSALRRTLWRQCRRWMFLTGAREQSPGWLSMASTRRLWKKNRRTTKPRRLVHPQHAFGGGGRAGRLRVTFDSEDAAWEGTRARRREETVAREMNRSNEWLERMFCRRLFGCACPPRLSAHEHHGLAAVNATLNGLSALFLMAGYIFIRRKNQPAHRNCMIAPS